MDQAKRAVEGMGLTLFSDTYRGRRVLITGHTGFKGSWLALWLRELGAQITAVALDPSTQPSHWDLLDLDVVDHREDIGAAAGVHALVSAARPEIVFHLAAQSLVRPSYARPVETWATNVMGTAHVLDACRQVDTVKAIVVITTDKVYANREWPWGYRENDSLGGHDPYSASKAACEILIESYRKAFFCEHDKARMASARSGNVVGGGDWSEDRLIPDLVRSISGSRRLLIRSPNATRPWQHVLECLAGYLLLGEKLMGGAPQFAEAWNFGPAADDNRTVAEVLGVLQAHWPELAWEVTSDLQPHEATLLYLDHAKASTRLGWRPVWSLERALQATADWYRAYYQSGAVESQRQLAAYVSDARAIGACWAQ
jgi:CDP-glucose 4,6-dehydratase